MDGYLGRMVVSLVVLLVFNLAQFLAWNSNAELHYTGYRELRLSQCHSCLQCITEAVELHVGTVVCKRWAQSCLSLCSCRSLHRNVCIVYS